MTDTPTEKTDVELFASLKAKAKDGSIVAGRHVKHGKKDYNNADEVGLIQDALCIDVGDDRGKFGPKTEASIMHFQEQAGLKADGKISRLTITAIEAAYKKVAIPYDEFDKITKEQKDKLISDGLEEAKKAIAKEVQELIKDKAYHKSTALKAIDIKVLPDIAADLKKAMHH